MQCFTHRGNAAIGICKACCRAVCADCAIDGERAISCSPVCEEDSRLLQQMNQRALKIYGISEKPRGLPQTVIAPLVMGGVLTCAAAIGYWFEPKMLFVPAIFLLMASGCCLGAWLALRKYREHGLNI